MSVTINVAKKTLSHRTILRTAQLQPQSVYIHVHIPLVFAYNVLAEEGVKG